MINIPWPLIVTCLLSRVAKIIAFLSCGGGDNRRCTEREKGAMKDTRKRAFNVEMTLLGGEYSRVGEYIRHPFAPLYLLLTYKNSIFF